ncbi:MAG: histidine ammonia-lyase [Acholeplasmataceae bacterium]|nr:histidine ammonia-lyase [Acholeplasmataceae bacterium]
MIILDGHSLTLNQLVSVARHHETIKLSEKSIELVNKASSFVLELATSDNPVYGINTGFGDLANVQIEKDKLSLIQLNLLKSHACGVGDPLNEESVRAMILLRINALIQGYSGTRLETLELMISFLDKNIIPVVFEKGSLGASGDLALLSHMSLPLLGLGEVFYKGERMPASKALKLADLKALDHLSPKEGLSLINGTQGMSAIGALVLYDAFRLLKFANLSLALTMEALEAIIDAFDPKIQSIRHHQGQINIAKHITSGLSGSLNTTHQSEKRVQDAYSIRCAPQVHGASLDVFWHVLDILNKEMNAVTDNPLLFVEEKQVLSAGNFHGQPLALGFDYLGMAIAELANISERRLERLVNPKLNNGLPPFLTTCSGVNSGFMITQYTAASLVSENKVLAHPASVDSIPSSANQEDHVSMGSISTRKARDILDNTYKVIALEMFAATQAIHFRGSTQLGKKTKLAYELISKHIPFIESDEIMYPHIHKIETLLKDETVFNILFKGEDIFEK